MLIVDDKNDKPTITNDINDYIYTYRKKVKQCRYLIEKNLNI